MNMAIRQALESLLAGSGYRRVDLSGGTVWVPGHYESDWPHDLAECVAVFRRAQSWTAGLHRPVYGAAIYRYYSVSGERGPHWTYSISDTDRLWSPEAAACEAAAVALARQVPVCIDAPMVIHPMGDAGLMPAEGRD